jgi:hypothetical protein
MKRHIAEWADNSYPILTDQVKRSLLEDKWICTDLLSIDINA